MLAQRSKEERQKELKAYQLLKNEMRVNLFNRGKNSDEDEINITLKLLNEKGNAAKKRRKDRVVPSALETIRRQMTIGDSEVPLEVLELYIDSYKGRIVSTSPTMFFGGPVQTRTATNLQDTLLKHRKGTSIGIQVEEIKNAIVPIDLSENYKTPLATATDLLVEQLDWYVESGLSIQGGLNIELPTDDSSPVTSHAHT